MRKNYQYEILADALIIPVPPILGKDNNPQQWWSINDCKILSATFRHEIETFLKSFSPYLPKEEKGFEPATPQRLVNLQPTISGLLAPKKSKSITFPEAQPISSITSSTRLGAIIATTSATPKESSKDWYPPDKLGTFPEIFPMIPSTSRTLWKKSVLFEDRRDLQIHRATAPIQMGVIWIEDLTKIPPRLSKRPPAVPMKPKEELNPVMDIVYMSHILLIHFITTRTFDIESLYHSTYFLNIPFNTTFYHLKTQNSFLYLLCLIYYIFATVMDIVYTNYILLIHLFTTRTFDMKSLYHSTYFFTLSLANRVLPFKNPKTPFIATSFYLLHFLLH